MLEAGKLEATRGATPTAAPVARGGILGTWEGVGTQDDGLSWPMKLDLVATEGICATAEYPTLDCRAEWECTGRSGDVVRGVEHLVDDSPKRCIDKGAMTFQLKPDGTLDWHWKGQGQTASATLRRR